MVRDTAQTNSQITPKYYLRSTALGEVISEANATGKKLKTSIYAAGAKLARQIIGYDTNGNPTVQTVEFDQWDASGMSYRRIPSDKETGETDPTGTGVGMNGDNYFLANLPPENDFPLYQPRGIEDVAVHQNGSEVACYEDDVVISCARAFRNIQDGLTVPKPLGTERRPGRKPPAIRPKTPRPVVNDQDLERTTRPLTLEDLRLLFARISWSPQSPTQQDNGLITTEPGRVSTNTTPQRLSEEDCNFLINHLFGDIFSKVATAFEPSELKRFHQGIEKLRSNYPADYSLHLALDGVIHIYGDAEGKRVGPLFIPANLDGSAPKPVNSISFVDNQGISKTFSSGTYKETFGFSNKFLFKYKNGLSISVAHVGGENAGRIGSRNANGSYQIGTLAGPGGDGDGYYRHSHIKFFRGGTVVDPRREFCSGGSKF